jgi:hypothetical protein
MTDPNDDLNRAGDDPYDDDPYAGISVVMRLAEEWDYEDMLDEQP